MHVYLFWVVKLCGEYDVWPPLQLIMLTWLGRGGQYIVSVVQDQLFLWGFTASTNPNPTLTLAFTCTSTFPHTENMQPIEQCSALFTAMTEQTFHLLLWNGGQRSVVAAQQHTCGSHSRYTVVKESLANSVFIWMWTSSLCFCFCWQSEASGCIHWEHNTTLWTDFQAAVGSHDNTCSFKSNSTLSTVAQL